MSDHELRDPTAESTPNTRSRRLPSRALQDATIGLFSIAKERSDEFIDYLEARLVARGLRVRRFAKATHTKVAAEPVLAEMLQHCDVVVGGLAD